MSSILFEKKRADVNSVRVRVTAILISVCTMAYFINMPVILGLAARDLGLVESQIWLLGGLFSGGVVLASALSILFIRLAHWQRLIFISGLLSMAAFLAPVFVSGLTFLFVCQGLAGLFAGFGYAVVIACLGDTSNPTRNYALVFAAQIVAVAVVNHLLPRLIEQGIGFEQALMAASGFAVVSIFLGMMMPKNGKRASLKSVIADRKPTVVFITLAVLLLVFVGGSTVRNSIEPIASAVDMAATGGGVMVILLLASAGGSLMAALIGERFGYAKPMAVAIGLSASILAMGVLQIWPDSLSFIVAFCLIGGAWNFGAAYVMGLVAKLDTSGRYTPLIAAVQVIGGVGGVAAVGLLVVGNSYVGAYILASVVWIVALIIFIQIAKRNQKLITASSGE